MNKNIDYMATNSLEDIKSYLGTDLDGLSEEAVQKNREKYGANSSEMIPYWCLPEDYPYKYQIERIVPMYPFSQDKTKYDRLINVLALYRLTLGQPRQEEMISIMQREDLSSDQMEELFFDLSPYSRKQKSKE